MKTVWRREEVRKRNLWDVQVLVFFSLSLSSSRRFSFPHQQRREKRNGGIKSCFERKMIKKLNGKRKTYDELLECCMNMKEDEETGESWNERNSEKTFSPSSNELIE